MFDDRLKKKALQNKEDKGWCHNFKTIMTIIVMLFYIIIIPLVDMPKWCLEEYNDKNSALYHKNTSFFISCQDKTLANYPTSGNMFVNNIATTVFDMLCIVYIGSIQIRKMRMRKFEKNDKIRNIIMFTCLAVQFVTTLISCITDTKSWTTSLLKPWIVMLSFKSFRSTFSLIALNIKDSFVTLIFIFACVFYASLFAAFAFYSTF